jgi:hypothetical protein
MNYGGNIMSYTDKLLQILNKLDSNQKQELYDFAVSLENHSREIDEENN